jgi:hypothetical protein
MGYDIDITRAPWLFAARHFPIRAEEWLAFGAARPDLRLHVAPDGTNGWFEWGEAESFFWGSGCGRAKHPSDETLRGMMAAATALDAWVMGEDGERYFPDADGDPVPRRDVPTMVSSTITRSWGGHGYRPMPVEDWTAVAARQPDFVTLDRIEAELPSGRRAIPCPPTPHWTGHPSGRPVPFIWQSDDVMFEVEHHPDPEWPTVVTEAGAAVLARARALAAELDATVE